MKDKEQLPSLSDQETWLPTIDTNYVDLMHLVGQLGKKRSKPQKTDLYANVSKVDKVTGEKRIERVLF